MISDQDATKPAIGFECLELVVILSLREIIHFVHLVDSEVADDARDAVEKPLRFDSHGSAHALRGLSRA